MRLAGVIQALITLPLLLQTRLTNIPAFSLFYSLENELLRTVPGTTGTAMSPTATTLTTLLMSHASYFALGGTNAISSLDLSLAYNGIASYNGPLVGLLLFIGNWAGPIWWSLAGLEAVLPTNNEFTQAEDDTSKESTAESPSAATKNMQARSERTAEAYIEHTTLLTLFLACATLATMAACAVLRTHLFVWTVFSPKFLYAVAWLVGWHWFVNGVLGGILVALD